MRTPALPHVRSSPASRFPLPASHVSLPFSSSRSGISLILALGVLSLLILIVTAFTVSMRIEHLAARNARDKVRSRQYLHAALTLATETLEGQLIGWLAPSGRWTQTTNTPNPDLEILLGRLGLENRSVVSESSAYGPFLPSSGYRVPEHSNLLLGVATNLLPPVLRVPFDDMAVGWTYIISTNAVGGGEQHVSGRLAFLAVDLCGQLDVHHLTTNQHFAALGVVSGPPDEEFFQSLLRDRRYLTHAELQGNRGIALLDPSHETAAEFLDALGVYSYDPAPHQLAYESWVGDRGTVLVTNKFDINTLPDLFEEDRSQALFSITNTLAHIGFSEEESKTIFWNLLNYLDEDRIPQTDTDHPWLDSYGIEAVPLINEMVLVHTNLTEVLTNHYAMAVELWYPFAPHPSPREPTVLNVECFTRTHSLEDFEQLQEGFPSVPDPPPEAAGEDDPAPSNGLARFLSFIVHNGTSPPEGSTSVESSHPVRLLSHPGDDFEIARPEPFAFPVVVTNESGQAETLFLPIGPAEYVTHVPYTNILDGTLSWEPVTKEVVNTVSFSARVTVDGHPVDEAPGPGRGDVPSPDRWYTTVTNTFAISVADPRRNGRIEDWETQPETLGAINSNMVAWTDAPFFQGLPILHRDGLPETIGEIGYLGSAEPWQSLDLFDPRAAALLDLWTVNVPGSNETQWAQGRIHALTEHPAAIRALFADTRFGTNRFHEANLDAPHEFAAVEHPHVLDSLTNALLAVRREFYVLPTNEVSWGTAVTLPFAAWIPRIGADPSYPTDPTDFSNPPPGYDLPGRDLLEDLIRDLPDRVTFRQNIILIFVRAQALAPNGRVTGDSLAAALMVRDSYTGSWAIRYLLPLH